MQLKPSLLKPLKTFFFTRWEVLTLAVIVYIVCERLFFWICHVHRDILYQKYLTNVFSSENTGLSKTDLSWNAQDLKEAFLDRKSIFWIRIAVWKSEQGFEPISFTFQSSAVINRLQVDSFHEVSWFCSFLMVSCSWFPKITVSVQNGRILKSQCSMGR